MQLYNLYRLYVKKYNLSVQFLLTSAPAGTGEQPPLQRRCVHTKLLRGAALPAVQKPVLAGVVLWPYMGHGHALDNAVKIIHRLSPSLYV